MYPILITFGQICNFRDPSLVNFYFYELTHSLNWMNNTLLFICSTNILVRLLTVNMKNCLTPKNPKMCDPILVTLSKMRPHYSQSSRENATPSSGTSPLASYKEVPHPPPRARNYGGPLYTAFRTSSTVTIKQLLCLKMDAKFPNFKQLGKQYPYQSKQFYKGLFIFWWR